MFQESRNEGFFNSPVPPRFRLGPDIRAGRYAGDEGEAEAAQGQTVIETGSGKPVGFRGALEREKAIWTRSAHLHAGQRQASTRRIEQAGHTTALDRMPGAVEGMIPRLRGASTHDSPGCVRLGVDRSTGLSGGTGLNRSVRRRGDHLRGRTSGTDAATALDFRSRSAGLIKPTQASQRRRNEGVIRG